MEEVTHNEPREQAFLRLANVLSISSRYILICEKDGEDEPAVMSGQVGVRVEEQEDGWQIQSLRRASAVVAGSSGQLVTDELKGEVLYSTPKVVLDLEAKTITLTPILGGEPQRHLEYEIDLERMTTSAELLDWIFQLNGKVWMEGDGHRKFLEAVEDACMAVFKQQPQGAFCAYGIDHKVDWKTGKIERREE